MVLTEKEDTRAGRSIPGRHCHPERSEGSVSLSTPPDNPTVPPWSRKTRPAGWMWALLRMVEGELFFYFCFQCRFMFLAKFAFFRIEGAGSLSGRL